MTVNPQPSEVSRFRAEDDEIAHYQSVSRLALTALAFGIFSFLAVASPVLWIVPIVAVLLGGLALRAIRVNPQQLTGRAIALLTLVLASFFLAFAPARHITRQRHLFAESQKIGEHWLNLLRDGKVREAHQLRMAFNERVTAESSLAEHYTQEQDKMMLESFTMQSPVADIVRWGQRCQIQFAGNSSLDSKGSIDTMTQLYEVVLNEGTKPFVMKIELTTARRSFVGTNEARWEVQETRVVSLPPNIPQ